MPKTEVKTTLVELDAANVDDVEWETTRFPTQFVKELSFRDGAAFFLTKTLPDGHTFPHQHDFRQLRLIMEGDYIINGETYKPGSLVEFPDKTVYEVFMPKGGVFLTIQLPGKNGQGPTDPRGLNYGGPPKSSSSDTTSAG